MVINENLSSSLSAIFGGKIIVNMEYGLAITRIEPHYEQILSISNPPKNLSIEWIVNKINKKNEMAQNIAEKRKVMIERMKEGLKNKGIGNYNVYLTNYGFGVCNLFGNGIEEAKNVISTCGIEFKKIEYSDAHWVVRVIL